MSLPTLPCALLLACLCGAASTLRAQTPTPLATPGKIGIAETREAGASRSAMRPPLTSSTTLRSFNEPQCRKLFQASDMDRDDRLDLFEASAVLPTMRGAVDRDTYRSLDKNRDGFLEWPEFADHVRHVLKMRGTIRLEVVAAASEPEPATTTTPAAAALLAAPAEASAARVSWSAGPLFRAVDSDASGDLDPQEVSLLLRNAGLPAAAVGRVAALDKNKDGKLSPEELAPAQPLVKGLVVKGPAVTADPIALPVSAADASALDANADGALDSAELTVALRRVDPDLGRHSAALIRSVDGDGNQVLGADELQRVGWVLRRR